MASLTRVTTWNSGDVLTAAALNGEFDNILSDYNGNIDNTNIKSGAAITPSKIAGTAATQTGAETLSNKVMTNPTINGSTLGYTTDSDGATVTFDLSASQIHEVTLTANRILALSNSAKGKCFIIRLIQDGSGSHTVTWFSTIKWPNNVAPTLTTTASKTDVFGFVCTGSGTYDGFTVGTNL